jgi:hypothetical protein
MTSIGKRPSLVLFRTTRTFQITFENNFGTLCMYLTAVEQKESISSNLGRGVLVWLVVDDCPVASVGSYCGKRVAATKILQGGIHQNCFTLMGGNCLTS